MIPDDNSRRPRKSEFHWVFAQLGIFVIYAIIPSSAPWDAPMWLRAVGVADIAFGLWLAVDGLWRLGRFLSPLPRPVQGGPLVTTGSFAIVRHPIYSGLFFSLWGWAWVMADINRLLVSIALLLFFNAKATVEERWLAATHPDHAAYRSRVSKLIPWIW